MTYTPTEQELIEMGFERESHRWTYNFLLGSDIHITFRNINHINGSVIPYWSFNGGMLFPRSREHLEQIILAFTK